MTSPRLQPVRVLFMDHVPRLSGAEQSLADLVVGLGAGPVEPIVVLPNDGPLAAELRAHGVLVRMVPMSRRMLETSRRTLASRPFAAVGQIIAFLAAGVRIFRLIREVRPQIVHTNTLKSHLLAVLPCLVARVPLVWHMRDILPEGWLRRMLMHAARFTAAIIVPSRAVADPFKGHRRVMRKLRLIPNGIRVREFHDARHDRSLREMMGVAAADPVVGLVARIAPWKGQDQFIRAAAMLSYRYPRAHFAIVGAPIFGEQDQSYEHALHRMVLDLGLEDRVTFLGWQPAPEAMAALDIVVHASQEPEPFGRTIIEAMAAGKPVVATEGGAVREILPPACGIVVPPGRPELLADALDRLLADRKIRKRMGEAGSAIADSYFPVQRTIQSVAQVYRSLAGRAPKRTQKRKASPLARVRRGGGKPGAQQQQQPISWPRPGTPGSQPQPSGRTSQRAQAQPRTHAARARVARAPHGRPVPVVRPQETIRIDLPDEVPAGEPSHGGRAAVATRRAKPRPVSGAQVAVLPSPVQLRTAPVTLEPTRSNLVRPKPLYDAAKRVMDLIIALAILVVGLPVWICVAIFIKLESRGSVLHKGTVVGKDRTPFTYYKFRSMRTDGDDKAHRRFIERYVRENGGHESDGEVIYKLIGDDRVTAVGRLIRKLSIDEIPQLLNVLRGEMSIVGPRPPLDYEYELYDETAKQRLSVLPGITGMQQVWHRHTASFEDKLKLDMKYVAQRSLWLDVKLVLHSFRALRGH